MLASAGTHAAGGTTVIRFALIAALCAAVPAGAQTSRLNGEVDNHESGVTILQSYRVDLTPNVGSQGGRPGVWSLMGQANNNSDRGNAVGITGQCRRFAGGACWSGHFNTIDNTITSGFASRAIEANIQADGEDVNNLRWVLDVASHNIPQVHDGDDTVHAGVMVRPATGDFENAIFVWENEPGTIRDDAIRVDVRTADIIDARSRDSVGRIRIGSGLADGILSQILSTGNGLPYTDVRSRATNGNGIFQIYVRDQVGLTKVLQALGNNPNPIFIMVDGEERQILKGPADSAGPGYSVLMVQN